MFLVSENKKPQVFSKTHLDNAISTTFALPLFYTYIIFSVTEAPIRSPVEASSSPDKSCSQQEVCASKTSCRYWLDRETKYKEGEDPSYIRDAKAQICNKQLKSLCCPYKGNAMMQHCNTYLL